MKKVEMTKYFGLSNAALHEWDKGMQGSKRKLLYELLASLHVEQVKQLQTLLNIDIEDNTKPKARKK